MNIYERLIPLKNCEKAASLSKFYKLEDGEYGNGDQFLGIPVPQIRKAISREKISLDEAVFALQSPWHEVRMAALIVMVELYKKGAPELKDCIFNSYIENRDRINNWDLVDFSAPHIVGAHLIDRDCKLLYELANSPILWDRRIAIVSTLHFIKNGSDTHTFKLSEILMNDREDLIQKACGWMLRECGKRVSMENLNNFLDRYAKEMSRTTLRYAIERHDSDSKAHYMLTPIRLQ